MARAVAPNKTPFCSGVVRCCCHPFNHSALFFLAPPFSAPLRGTPRPDPLHRPSLLLSSPWAIHIKGHRASIKTRWTPHQILMTSLWHFVGYTSLVALSRRGGGMTHPPGGMKTFFGGASLQKSLCLVCIFFSGRNGSKIYCKCTIKGQKKGGG